MASGIRKDSRGAARREAIVSAAGDLLQSGGPGALTHRAVAEAAEVPLAATTYYFTSKEELLAEGLARAAGAEVELLSGLADVLDRMIEAGGDPAEAIADLLAGALTSQYASITTKFEVYTAAMRRPALRAACEQWIAAFLALGERAMARAGADDPRRAGALLVAGVDGLLLRRLALGADPDPHALRDDLHALVVSLARSEGASA